MDFNQLLNKMREIDSSQSQSIGEECGAMPTPNMPAQAPQETPPPSMTVNLNAQGLDNIESMMKLFQKVNPDMMPKEPANDMSFGTTPAIMQVTPSDQKPINKLLPDLSDEPSVDSPGDPRSQETGRKSEAWNNEPDEQMHDLDSLIRNGDDLHKKKGTYPKVAGGDNPMQRVSEDNSEAQDYIRDMTAKIQSGEVDADEVESEFFTTLSFYDIDDDQIMRSWEKITGTTEPRSRRASSDQIENDIEDLVGITSEPYDYDDDNDDDINKYRDRAKSGSLGIDKSGFGTGLESVDDLRSQIREDLKRRLASFKS